MTEPSTPDNWRPSPRPRTAATTTSEPIAWPTDPIQVIPVEPFDELRQLHAAVARLLGVDDLDHERIQAALSRHLVEHGRLTLGVQAALDTVEHLPCIGDCPRPAGRRPGPVVLVLHGEAGLGRRAGRGGSGGRARCAPRRGAAARRARRRRRAPMGDRGSAGRAQPDHAGGPVTRRSGPQSIVQDLPNESLRDAVLGRELTLRYPAVDVTPSNLGNLYAREYRVSVVLSTHIKARLTTRPMGLAARNAFRPQCSPMPASSNEILHVVGRGARNKVRRVATRRIVACVPEHRRRDLADKQLVSEPVGTPGLAQATSSSVEQAIPAGHECSGPWPAAARTTRAIDLLPEESQISFCKLKSIHGEYLSQGADR